MNYLLSFMILLDFPSTMLCGSLICVSLLTKNLMSFLPLALLFLVCSILFFFPFFLFFPFPLPLPFFLLIQVFIIPLPSSSHSLYSFFPLFLFLFLFLSSSLRKYIYYEGR